MNGKKRFATHATLFGLAASAMIGGLSGCQTHVGGMTLPSPDYLKDRPDYIAPAPQYGHSRELSSMQRAYADANPTQGIRVNRPVENRPAANPAPLAPAPAPAPANAPAANPGM